MILKIFNRISYEIKNFFPKPHMGNKKYNLAKRQIYPEGNHFIDSLNKEILISFEKSNFNLRSRVLSLGTCFAEEFAFFLLKKSKNYKILEKNVFNFIVNWGRVYTVSNLKQIINYSLDKNFKVYTRLGCKGYFDPLRDYSCGSFETKKMLLDSIKNHRNLSKYALLNTNFIFLTLGQTEAWIDKKDNFTWGAAPIWCEDFYQDRKNYLKKNFNLEEIINDLNEIVQKLQKANASIKIFLTLSPVPSQATFFDCNVILSSSTGKAKLRLAIDNILQNYDNIYYIPSYENVILHNKNFKIDNRHVKKRKVKDIFSVFK